MKKTVLTLACGFLASFSISAAECNAGQKSNYTVIPHYYASNNSDAAFYVTNHSDKPLQVKIDIYTHTGANYNDTLAHYYMFSSSNNPFQQWANLGSKEQGMLHIPMINVPTSGHARIAWKSEECLGTPVTVSLQRTTTGYPGLSIEGYGPF